MKRAFTLIELLVVIAIIAILAAILFPVFAQAKVAAKKTKSLAEIKQLGTSTIIYQADHDDLFPLGFGYYPGIGWMSAYAHDVPADWYPGVGPTYLNFVNGLAINSTSPYRKNNQLLTLSGGIEANEFDEDFSIAVKEIGRVNYAFNGLLQSYSSTAVNRVSDTPMFTSFWGNKNILAYGLSDPQLYCVDANSPCQYVPASASCSGANGSWTYAITLNKGMGSNHVFGNGSNWVYTDTSAKFKKLGMSYGGSSDFRNDPYSQYDKAGVPHGAWYDQYYCHMYAFTPDWDGTVVGTPYEEAWP